VAVRRDADIHAPGHPALELVPLKSIHIPSS
jgi:hypothetical protein